MGRSDLNNIDANPPVRSQRDVLLLDDASNVSLWTPTDNAANLAAANLHVLGSQGLSFDKVAGATDAGVQRTLPRLNGSARFSASDLVELVLLVPAGTNVSVVVLRLGANATNYAEWQFPSGDIHVGQWDRLAAQIVAQDAALQQGIGADLSALQFAQVIVRLNAQAQVFSGAILDSIVIRGSN